ncbi:hypothetical protein R3P38DRAFT_2786796 [Favolaschia claudopus]|uniref:Integrase core domain-containing protein n=1 Tax=Favolaschia claudopus TaxID=2862362 RepID=A0AAW0APL2_9AGAR
MYGDSQEVAAAREESNVAFVEPVTVVRNGKRGRPQKVLNPTFVAEAMSSSRKITVTQLAKLMGISRPTLIKHLRANNVYHKFSDLTKPSSMLSSGPSEHRNPTLALVTSWDSFAATVSVCSADASIHLFTLLMDSVALSVSAGVSNGKTTGFLTFLDITVAELIKVTALRASTNNRATTVLEVFLEAVGEYGLPSRVRGDHGAENKKVPVYMIITQGLGRASFMWGSLVPNLPAVGVHSSIEAVHGLERSNPHHLWLLHLLFLDFINDDSEDFRAEWNLHPISGQVEKGVYMTEYPNIHPSILQRYYGVHGRVVERQPGETGAGQLDDEHVPAPSTGGADDDASDLASDDELVRQVEDAQAENFHHEPVAVPKHASPFEDDETTQLSHDALGAAEELEFVPRGFGLLREEWEEGLVGGVEKSFVLPFQTQFGGRARSAGAELWLF